jgi:hypothetical protein
MSDDRKRAMRRGLGMAAKVTAVAGLLAASAASAQAAEAPRALEVSAAQQAAEGARVVHAAELAERVRLGGNKGGCGCAPCWGPPAPPAMSYLEQWA